MDGNTAFEEFLDKIAEQLNKQWSDNSESEDVSKDDRHVLRLAEVLHLFYDQLKKRLESLPASPPANVVNKATLKQAIALAHYFAEQRKVLDQVMENTLHDASNEFILYMSFN